MSAVDIPEKEPGKSTAAKADELGLFHGAHFQNCSFNIQMMNGPVTKMASKSDNSHKRQLIVSEDEDD